VRFFKSSSRFVADQYLFSKFFGRPNGTMPPAKQAKLAFSSKATPKEPSPSSSKENEDVDMKDAESEVAEDKPTIEKKEEEDIKDEDSDVDVKSKVESKAAVDTKENVKPEKGMTCGD
jgi:DNA ligase-1